MKFVKKEEKMEQWYERYPQLLDAERAAMYDFQGDKAVLGTLADGRACWCVRCQPKLQGERSGTAEYMRFILCMMPITRRQFVELV